ncbi:hypothetical protein RYX36_015572 [Vicia faba]
MRLSGMVPDIVSFIGIISACVNLAYIKQGKETHEHLVSNTSLKQRKIIVELCDIVASRGARLVFAGILGILKKIGRDTVKAGEKKKSVVALDGGLFAWR